MKTSDLIGPALDWAVATAQGHDVGFRKGPNVYWIQLFGYSNPYNPSTDWSQGGPIIEREAIRTKPESPYWEAETYTDDGERFVGVGGTLLIAAMRCYCASKLGDEVDVPEELV